jgi:predicted Ser/Thr protein kinase
MDSTDFLNDLNQQYQDRFKTENTLLSFQEYLNEVSHAPHTHLRDAPTYIRDMFDYFGTEDIQRPYGTFKRFKVFDAPFDQGRDRVVGQEKVQNQIYGLLTDFVRIGRANRLILLHGPNGSAKSSLIQCIMRGLEAYSQCAQGALYTFNWVFPSQRKESASIGFGQTKGLGSLDSFAHLSGQDLESRIPSDLRDHPLLLVPKENREALLSSLLNDDVKLPLSLQEGDLSALSAEIFDALLKSYKGDLAEVFKHIQVERFTISRRYRRGASTVDPQLRVDATVRQVTADRNLSTLPASLQHLNLFQPMGHLVEGNRGMVEYNDLLKRPVETFKYLLSTCEQGMVRLDQVSLSLDSVLIGSCNFEHLEAFKEIPDFTSFKGRIDLIQVPYLLDMELEKDIYQDQIQELSEWLELTDDLSEILAIWAVMTRLERPQPVHYPSDMKPIIENLTPYEKAKLYAYKQTPIRLKNDERKRLSGLITDLFNEPRPDSVYEGLIGASPREMKALLMSAARNQKNKKKQEKAAFTPLNLFAAIKELCTQESLYPFLRRKPSGTYYQPKDALKVVSEWYFIRFEERLHQAMGLVKTEDTFDLWLKYIDEIKYAVQGEKKAHALTGRYEDPDETFMRQIESRVHIKGKAQQYRSECIQRIASYRLSNPDSDLDYKQIFEEELRLIQESYFEEQKTTTRLHLDELLMYLHDRSQLQNEQTQRAERTLASFNTLGYPSSCIEDVLYTLLEKLKKE